MYKLSTNSVLKGILAVAIAGAFVSCGSEADTTENDTIVDSSAVDSVETQETEQVIHYAMPSPRELTAIMKRSGATYQRDILHSTDQVDNYSTSVSKAVNLGIYGTDLSYIALFDDSQEALHYLVTAKKLADGLGLNDAFEAELVENLEKNISDKDSLLAMIDDFYFSSNVFMDENDRMGTMAVVIAGGWIEGLHIATKMVSTYDENNEIVLRIAEQKVTLENMIAMITEYNKSEGLDVTNLVNDLNGLLAAYEGVNINYSKQEVESDTDNNITRIVNPSTVAITAEQYKAIAAKVDEIRNNCIQ